MGNRQSGCCWKPRADYPSFQKLVDRALELGLPITRARGSYSSLVSIYYIGTERIVVQGDYIIQRQRYHP